MGEGFGSYSIGCDEDLIQHVSSINIACGFHAGDPLIMDATVKLARRYQVAVGAHPGYPDLGGFGRRDLNCSLHEIRQYILYQVGALQAICAANSIQLNHVKPHGALYNLAMKNQEVFQVILKAVASISRDLLVICLAGPGNTWMSEMARQFQVRLIFEAFPDRTYLDDGSLAPRSGQGSVITDPSVVAERALQMACEKTVISCNGQRIAVDAETLCIHGDSPGAVALAKAVHAKLQENGCTVCSPFELK